MENYEFNLLPINDQVAYTWEIGTYLASKIEGDFSVNLYWVDAFYVEIYYDHRENCIEKVRSFKSRKLLDTYLGNIDLDIN